MEYCTAVWASSLTLDQRNTLECLQKRALNIILPQTDYKLACEELKIETLERRREYNKAKLFKTIQNPEHRLQHLLPTRRSITHALRNNVKYELPKCKTNRHKNSFIPWCLYNLQ